MSKSIAHIVYHAGEIDSAHSSAASAENRVLSMCQRFRSENEDDNDYENACMDISTTAYSREELLAEDLQLERNACQRDGIHL